jgi:RND family efflux transporter MFP subunit
MRLLRLAPFVLLSLLAVIGCSKESRSRGDGRESVIKKVTVSAVEQRSIPATQKVMGTVVARSQARIETKVQARVERIVVAIGSRVRAGELLAELDIRDFNARVRQAQAVSEQTSQDLKRFETLLSKQAATQQEYDAVKTRALVAESNRQEAEAMLNYARIVAPFSGVVTRKMIEAGDLAIPGRPMFELEADGAPRFALTIPESDINMIMIGDSVQIEVPAADTSVTGLVRELSPSADPVSRSYELRIDLPGSTKLRPGQFGRLLLPDGENDALYIPKSALVHRGQLDLVYVVSAQKRLSLRLIRSGREQSGLIEVLSGLTAGEYVVTSGGESLSDGDQVEFQP